MTVPFRDCYVLISTNGADWTSLSDTATVEIVTGTARRQTTSLKPYGYDVAIIVPGKRTPLQLIITYNYADAAVDNTILTAYENHTAFYVAFAPRGNVTGNFLYTSAAGLITSLPVPEGQRHSGTIVLNRFTFETSGLTKSVIGIT